ncbi:hypothetical protein EDC04DRAFT_2760984 [Pisolithus marmoratus]|nr:hypothetical protein EDC04DRAFT_2760984 [Pisolithus marmoratus]
MLAYALSTLYLPQFFASPFAFLGHDTTRSALLNGIPRVTIRAALVKKSGFSCAVVSQAGFVDISGCGACIHSISFPTSSPHFPSPSPGVSWSPAQPLSFGEPVRYLSPLAPSSSTVEFSSDPRM